MPPKLRRLLGPWHYDTWIAVDHFKKTCIPELTDLFNLAMGALLGLGDECATGGTETTPYITEKGTFPMENAGSDSVPISCNKASYVDDVAFMFSDTSADGLIHRLQRKLCVIVVSFGHFGLSVNFSEDKTEIMANFPEQGAVPYLVGP